MPSDLKTRVLEANFNYLVPGRVDRFRSGGIDFVPHRREGYRYWDIDGREVLDLHLNGGTFNLGHCNPDLVNILSESARDWDIGNHHFPSQPKAELAEALIAAMPGTMQYVVFTPSGSEANDVAIKSARWATGRSRVVALDAGYHGRTGLSGAAGDDETARFFHSDDPRHFLKVPFNDLEAMEKALRNRDVALVMMEPIPATYGFPLPENGYLPGVKALCEQYGTLFLADEVQTGLGRTGHPWAIQAFDVEPDMLVTGKGLSGGLYPMAAVVMTAPCGAWLRSNGWGHVSTFGGADLGCLVAKKALAMSICPATLDNVNRMSGYLREGLENIRPRFPFFVGIRQQGLVMGLQFDSSTTSWLMMRALYESGIWAIVAAFDETVIQFKPGLLVDTAYCDEVLQRFERACIWYVANANNIMMETHTDISAVNRAEQFARAALPQWGFENAKLELIKHRENTVYRVNLPDGRCYALRVHRAGYHSAAEIESELEWMRALAGDGILTPTPIGAVGGEWVRAISVADESEPRNCSVFTWSEGVLFDNLGDVQNGMLEELVNRYRQLGALAARVHNQSEHWQAPANFTRHSWDADGLLGEDPLWGRFWEHPLMTVAQRRLVLKARIVLGELLKTVGQSPDCYGLIHADFLPDNILVHDGQLCLIDFDDCGYGWHMFEMATSLFPRITEPYFDSLVDAYVAGYRTQRTFTQEHLEIFPAFILLRGLTYLGWLLTRAESLVNRDRIAQEIINGLCDHIPELLAQLNPVQRVGVDFMAWQQARRLDRNNV
jgi:acetylornithine/succinyldiaminopimelate/putrescine aminotransferase/Ser/Thr protein kinase RdoA (MazF antagonist)